MTKKGERNPSIPQRSSTGRTAARAQAAAAAEAAPAPAPAAGVEVREHGHGALVPRGAAKTPNQIVDAKLIWDCWKETARGVKSRAQFEAFCKSQGIRVEWKNLDGGGVNCILHVMMGKSKRVRQIQCQYKHGQDHFAERRMAEAFGVPQLLYVDDDGKIVAEYADGVFSSALLRIHHAAPDAAISVRSLLHDLETLAALDSASRDKNWVACSSKGRVGFNRGSKGPAFLDDFESVQKALASDPTKAAAVPYIDMRDANAAEQFLHAIESALTFALGAGLVARAGSPLASKEFLRERTKTLGSFETLEAKGAAELIAFDKLETLQRNLVATSSRRALVVAPTEAGAHLATLAVEPLAVQSEKAATPEQAVTRLQLLLKVRPACTKQCVRWRGVCKCKRTPKKRGKLTNIIRSGEKIVLSFDDSGKDVTLYISSINERLEPANGKGDGLSLVRKAARAAARAGWNAPPELASVTRAQSG